MSGYLNAKEATDKVFLDNWFRTGDIAVRDSEGFYTWIGRIKSIIKPGGIIVYPEEVTEIINKYPGVLETVTFGMPDPVFTEIVISAVSATSGTMLKENDIMEFCRVHLVQNKVPKRIYILPKLPKGRSGKVQLEEVKKIVLATIDSTETYDNTALIDKVRSVAANCFKVDAKSLSMETLSEATPGWDSLSHLELASSIEKSFNIKLTVSEVMTIRRLKDIVNILEGKNI
jgi:long-chain acyl-CoA synthetase